MWIVPDSIIQIHRSTKPLSFQESACSLSTLPFLKFPENNFEVLKLLENIMQVLKILENKLESMKILENNLESLKLHENQPATNIILQGLPADIYSLVNHHRVAKDLWERVQLLMQGVDPIAYFNKTMAFQTVVASSSNATSSGGNNAGRQARVVKCYNYQGEGHMARKCTQPKRPRNAAWYKDKAMLVEAREAGQILDKEQLAFPADSVIRLLLISRNSKAVPGQHFPTMVPDVISRENRVTRTKKYAELSAIEKIQADCDMKATNIILQGLPADIYSLERECKLYDGRVISVKHVAMPVIDDEETLILEEESRSKLSKKEKDPEAIKQNISHKPIDYEKLNRLSDDFGKQAPKELPKVSLVNESLKKLKFHLARFDNVVKVRTTPHVRRKEFFENNDLKAQLQDKDSTICKLKDIIKSMRERSKEENVNYDYGEIETKNVFKEQFDSIKKTRVRTKEQSDSLDDKLNLKSAENKDLKAQIQDKVFVITSLKNNLRKVKAKEIVDIAVQIPSANTIVPGMFKLDLEPLSPRLLQNKEAHIYYLKYNQEQADILHEIVEQAKQNNH
ncbi:hypothetical protein Tco_0549602 [Tanacetum coccineum]